MTDHGQVSQGVMRRTPRELDEGEKYNVDLIKQMGDMFVSRIDGISSKGGREFAIAKTKMEEAVMWAVKGITK